MTNTDKELKFIKRAVLQACHPDWDWKTIGRKGTKFLGQPITLARVLIASPYMKIRLWDNYLEITNMNIRHSIKFKWDLDKDLDGQSPETILAISKLLGYEQND